MDANIEQAWRDFNTHLRMVNKNVSKSDDDLQASDYEWIANLALSATTLLIDVRTFIPPGQQAAIAHDALEQLRHLLDPEDD